MSHALHNTDNLPALQENEQTLGRFRFKFWSDSTFDKTTGKTRVTFVRFALKDVSNYEEVQLNFYADTRKLMSSSRKKPLCYLSYSKYENKEGSKAAHHVQKSLAANEDDCLDTHTMQYNEYGKLIKETYSNPKAKAYHDFLDEQLFMKTLKAEIEKADETKMSHKFRDNKPMMLEYLNANIACDIPGLEA